MPLDIQLFIALQVYIYILFILIYDIFYIIIIIINIYIYKIWALPFPSQEPMGMFVKSNFR